jgi:GNAT superfamily N-acetyltransferase
VSTPIEIRLLNPDEGAVLTHVAAGVFDGPVDERWREEFLKDSRHHLAVALDADCVVGMASAVHYVHPDKAPQLWINEVGVASTHQNQGFGKRLVAALLECGKAHGCTEAWVLTEQTNEAAMRLYGATGGRQSPNRPVMFEFDLIGKSSRAETPLRKQYHFRPSERGLLAWDIGRLIQLSQDFPRIQIPLTAIRELDEPFWFGQGNAPTCRAVAEHASLIEAADLSFPIILSSDGRVMDGMHRVAKASMQGKVSLEAVQFSVDPAPDHIGVHPDHLP